MKKIFPGYYRKTDEDIKKIWDSGIILFDTNVLLNLYRYSDSTRETLLDLISKFSKQIYLPHQAALEYNRNRYEVIAEQEKAYKEFLEKISQIQKDLQSSSKPPFLTSKVDNDLNKVFAEVSSEVQNSIKKYCEYLKQDPIYDRISYLFDKKITDSYNNEKLKEIYKEGEERYKMKIPPGFEDEKTKGDNRKFGDLVLWKQVVDIAKKLKKDVILITDERKLDWWWKIKDGRNMGARQELVDEMKFEANVEFHMYSSERFLSYGQLFLKEQINNQALNEISAMKKAEIDEIRRVEYFKREQVNLNEHLRNEHVRSEHLRNEHVRSEHVRNEHVKNEFIKLQSQILEMDYIIHNMNNEIENQAQCNIDKYYEGEVLDKELPDYIKIMIEDKNEFEKEREMLVNKFKHLNKLYINN